MRYEVLKTIPDTLYEQSQSWDGFTIYHTKAWHRVLKKAFGWQVQALVGIIDDEFVCYLPFVRKHRLLRIKHIALPLSHCVGFACHSNHQPRNDLPLSPLEIHRPANIVGAHMSHENDTTYLDLTAFGDIDALYKTLDNSSIRYMIRRADKNGILVRSSKNGDQINALFDLTVETRQRQGSPVYPAKFFWAIHEQFGEQFKVYVAYKQGTPISASAFYYFNREVIYGFSASTSDRELKRLGGNERVMWEALRDAFTSGAHVMDFGTSPLSNPGLRRFKEKWGGISEPLLYTYMPHGGGIQRDSTAVRAVGAVLQKMPTSLFQHLSPYLLKWVT
jgi:hypothetical protein